MSVMVGDQVLRADDRGLTIVGGILQLRKIKCSPPPERGAVIAEPSDETIGVKLSESLIIDGRNRLARLQLSQRTFGPPHSRYIDARQIAVVISIDVTEG